MKNLKEDAIQFFEKRLVSIDKRLKMTREVIIIAASVLRKPLWFRLDLWLDNFFIKRDISHFVKRINKLKEEKKYLKERLEELKNPWIQ